MRHQLVGFGLLGMIISIWTIPGYWGAAFTFVSLVVFLVGAFQLDRNTEADVVANIWMSIVGTAIIVIAFVLTGYIDPFRDLIAYKPWVESLGLLILLLGSYLSYFRK